MSLEIERVVRRFGTLAALDDVSLAIAPGTFFALLGPSGSGKSTLLRILGGLDFPEAGRVQLDGEDITAQPARQRRMGFVFQNYVLFRHMTAAQNIGFGLSVRPRDRRPSRKDIAGRVEELLALVQLDGLGHRFPDQLSGGQRQRVALARALAIEPRLLLLDEPFGALDAKVRKDLRRWLRALHDRTGVTTILVTHDQEEAMELADRIAILRAGRIEQQGAPQHLYDRPATPFVHGFLGDSASLPCIVRDGVALFADLDLPPVVTEAPDGRGQAFFRANDIDVVPVGAGQPNARVTQVQRIGPLTRIVATLADGTAIEASLHHAAPAALLAPGTPCTVKLRAARVFVSAPAVSNGRRAPARAGAPVA